MLEVSTLCCLRGEREVFRDVTFAVGPGAWLHVRGENGAGKTTLLRA
ncbi:MAG: ATP-binding cassette domain-containing protein, partial [Betaproteobacteria bacterium]|nr:ATP-binding cassette domain-containing protein [Betaproteobacteria bacterium]